MGTAETQPSTSAGYGEQARPDQLPKHKHGVQFYDDESFLLDTWSRLIGAAVSFGDCALVVATKAHQEGLTQRLTERGLDLDSATRQGRYLALDAVETLSQFMVDGWPDRARFCSVFGPVIEQLAVNSQGRERPVVAFGEMVAVLCAGGRAEAAFRVEQLWNELAQTHLLRLHCAYPIRSFSQEPDAETIGKICAEHSHVIPSETYSALSNDKARLHNVIFLQQREQALATEIGERRKIQQALHAREEELRDFLENAVVGMHWVDSNGIILWANKAEMDLLGYSPDEYIGHHIREFHADERVIDDILERLGRIEQLQGYRARLKRKDGSTCYAQIHSNVLMQDGRFVHTRCFTVDMTKHERSARRIAAQHAVTRVLAEADSFDELIESILQTICEVSECAMGALWLTDEQGQQLRCIRSWRRSSSDFPTFETLTKSVRFSKGTGLPGRIWATNQPAWIPELSVVDNFPRQAAAAEAGLRSAFGFPIRSKNAFLGAIEFFSRDVRKPDEEFMEMMAAIGIQIGLFMERRHSEDARNQLAAIVSSSDDAIASKDLNGIVASWNHGAERMFGYKAEEIIGRPITLIIPPELQVDEPRILAKMRAGERIEHFETVRIRKNGERINVSLTVSPIRDQRGTIIGVAKIVRDITQQKKLEEALRTSEKLTSVGRLAATVAHEINNPLEAVTNYIYLAKQDPKLPENVRDYLERADKELGRVSHIAQQTLGFYRDNAHPAKLVVTEVVEDVLTIYESKVRYKNLQVTKRIEPDLVLHTSQGELKQILSNLIANAIDASQRHGRLVIAARRSHDIQSGVEGVRITVADNGSGMSAEDQRKIFTPFFTTKKEVGTGLGLWIARELLEKRGGSIHFRSSNGTKSGTVIAIFLPLQEPAAVTRVA